MPIDEPLGRFDLRPGLTATVHGRAVLRPGGRLPCWTYLSDGLLAHGQKEISVTLLRRPGDPVEDFPDAVLELLGMIGDLAARAQTVDVGDYTEFGPTGFLGDPSLRGLLYLPFQAIPGLDVSGPALTAILVPADELEVAKTCGVTRVMARLGQASSHFPCPDWSDPHRAAVVSAAEMRPSVLARMPTLALGAGWVARRGDDITLQLPPGARRRLELHVAALHPRHPLALLTGVPPTADALLVWQPGQPGPVAISAPGSSGEVIAGCFCAFLPKQAVDDVQLFEDGFVVMLTTGSWRRARRALTSGEDLSVPAGPGGLAFHIRPV